MKETLRLLGSRLLPHDTRKTTAPPAALPCADGQLIIVASMMRSGTHLLLDSMFNNFPALRRTPLFVDLDSYERQALPVEPLKSLRAAIIKTHFPETPLAPPYEAALSVLARRAIVLTPHRSSEEVRRSLEKWGMEFSADEFAAIESRVQNYWDKFKPMKVRFRSLLDPAELPSVLQSISQRTGLKLNDGQSPVLPSRSRFGVYVDKTLTRMLGCRAPRINTTIGYRLAAKQRS